MWRGGGTCCFDRVLGEGGRGKLTSSNVEGGSGGVGLLRTQSGMLLAEVRGCVSLGVCL